MRRSRQTSYDRYNVRLALGTLRDVRKLRASAGHAPNASTLRYALVAYRQNPTDATRALLGCADLDLRVTLQRYQ